MASPSIGELLVRLTSQRILPVLRSRSADAACDEVARCRSEGLEVVELTTSVPGWEVALEECARASSAPVGLGTVTLGDVARRALEAGAAFLVSPYPSLEVRAVALEAGAAFVEGGFSAGELALIAGSGAAVAKVFPAHLGGPQYLRSLAAVLPGLALIPTGGILLAEAAAYLEAGAPCVGVGSALFDDPAALAALRRDS